MKAEILSLSFAIVAALFIPASQTIAAGSSARTVSPEHRIQIEQPRNSGQWKAHDITVDYSYSKDQGQIDLSGKVAFASFFLMGYSRLQDFRLALIFLDENGRVIEEVGLVTNRGSLDPFPFNRRIKLPPGAASVAFSYDGNAIESGMAGGGHTSFSFTPAR